MRVIAPAGVSLSPYPAFPGCFIKLIVPFLSGKYTTTVAIDIQRWRPTYPRSSRLRRFPSWADRWPIMSSWGRKSRLDYSRSLPVFVVIHTSVNQYAVSANIYFFFVNGSMTLPLIVVLLTLQQSSLEQYPMSYRKHDRRSTNTFARCSASAPKLPPSGLLPRLYRPSPFKHCGTQFPNLPPSSTANTAQIAVTYSVNVTLGSPTCNTSHSACAQPHRRAPLILRTPSACVLIRGSPHPGADGPRLF